MVLIPPGVYAPLFRRNESPAEVAVPAFYLDVRPVTNAEFLAFVRRNPKWRRSVVLPLYADAGYLGDWAADLDPGPRAPADSPVVRVSWFAARAYAHWLGKRLPATREWERAAAAGFTSENGSADPVYREAVLDWFAVPTPTVFPAAGSGRANFLGARDLTDLVWEWVDDFGGALLSAGDSNLSCGGAASGARDFTDYPAFMRAGFRSSLRASYVVPNLGFRCAKSL